MDVFKCSFSDTWHSQKLLEGKADPARLAGLFNAMHDGISDREYFYAKPLGFL